jgi:hypothetical protein
MNGWKSGGATISAPRHIVAPTAAVHDNPIFSGLLPACVYTHVLGESIPFFCLIKAAVRMIRCHSFTFHSPRQRALLIKGACAVWLFNAKRLHSMLGIAFGMIYYFVYHRDGNIML